MAGDGGNGRGREYDFRPVSFVGAQREIGKTDSGFQGGDMSGAAKVALFGDTGMVGQELERVLSFL